MSTRRPPLPPEYLIRRWATSLTPGAIGGRLASPAPTLAHSRLKAITRTNPSGSPVISALSFQWDRKVLTGGGAQTWALTYTPVKNSCHVFLNGLELDENTDYTLSGSTVSLLTAAAPTTGDVLWARYAYLSALPNPAADVAGLPTGVLVWEASSLAGVVADGGAVTSWTDDSGTYTLNKQGSGTATFHATGGPNGGPYVSFDGNVYFQDTGTHPSTLGSVFQLLQANAATWATDTAQTGSYGDRFFICKGATSLFYQQGGTVLVAHNGSSVATGADYSMSPINSWFVGERQPGATAQTAFNVIIGHAPSYTGVAYLGKMIATVWAPTILSTADRDSVYRWFNQRFGLSCAIP